VIIDNKEVRSKSNFSGDKKIKMGISAEGIAHIISVVTDLYADPDSACLREYGANALDSHVEAGQKRPIEITLPTIAKPNLVVQDWGTGMSMDDIEFIYSQYGASTKRKSDDYIGALGLGCKSALSLSPSFTLTSIKNGKKSVVLIHRGEDGVGEIEPIVELDTNEPNGVTVSIPVTDNINEYAAKAKAIFITWARGTVLIDGKEPALSITTDADFVRLGKAGYLSRQGVENRRYGYSRNGSMIVNMGGIGYPVDPKQMEIMFNTITDDQFPQNMRNSVSSIKSAIRNNLTLVVNVSIGDVDLVPSRESVRWTRKSVDAVTLKIKDAILALPAALADDFKDCKTHLDVLSKNVMGFAETFRSIYKQVQWNGKNLPANIPLALTTQDNYLDAEVQNFLIRFDTNGDRQSALKNENNQYFSFGFETSAPRSFSTAGLEVSTTWIFVKVANSEEVRKRVSAYVNSFVEDLRETGDIALSDNVRVVAHKGNLLDNEWLKAVHGSSKRLFSVTLEDIANRAKSRRRIKAAARATGQSSSKVASISERVSLTYSVTKFDENGIEATERWNTQEIDAYVAEKSAKLYIDNNELIRDSYYNSRWDHLKNFVPANSLIVSVGHGRKVDALVKRLETVASNFDTDIRKEINSFAESITAIDYFHRDSPFTLLSDSDIAPYLEDGFLKSAMTAKGDKAVKLRSMQYAVRSYLSPDKDKWNEKFEAMRQELTTLCILVFGASRVYSTDRQAYNKALGVYLNGLKGEIEAVVAKHQ
jgi:hypothetical protein